MHKNKSAEWVSYTIGTRTATGGPLFANSQRRERFTSPPLHLFAELLLLRSRAASYAHLLLSRHVIIRALYSRFIIHTSVIIFRVYTYYPQLHVCVCGRARVYYRLRVYYNLIYIFNVFIARSVKGEIIITIMTADYCSGRGSPLYIS